LNGIAPSNVPRPSDRTYAASSNAFLKSAGTEKNYNQGIFSAETPVIAAAQLQEATVFGAITISIFLDGREITDLDLAALVASETSDPSNGL
jgi:hypothetical protein